MLALSCAMYTTEKVDEKVRPQPDVSKFFVASEIKAYGENTAVLTMGETFMRQNREQMHSELIKHVNNEAALHYLRMFEIQDA
eukprot:9502864-Pyramimonas_sp.AAC.1